jgi:hypothetical protein
MDLMFKSAFGESAGSSQNSQSSSEDKPRKQKHDRKDPPELLSRGSVSELGTIDESADSRSFGTSVDESSMSSSVSSLPSHGNNTRLSYPLSPVLESPNPGMNEPIYHAIQQVKLNDPSFKTLDLDGQEEIPKKLWKALFQAIENNNHVNQISMQDCGLTDDKFSPLILSLVENDTIIALNLSQNPGLTDDTGRLLVKVLKGGNDTICDIDLSSTSISQSILDEIEKILLKRITVDVV